MGNNEDNSEGYHNPNAEDYVLQPGQKRVRFSFCEPVFQIPSYDDEDFDENCEEEPTKEELSRFSQLRTRRRDSVYPIMENDKSIIIDQFSEDVSVQTSSDPPKETDPFEIIDYEEEPSTPWADLSTKEKVQKVTISLGKGIALLVLLYFFVCSLDLLSKGFRLIGGRTAGEIFQQSEILQNPVVGVMIGILTTVLVQSSSTSTSIIVGMVASNFMTVQLAIPLIMGANIGTSITNTIVSFMQAADKDQFRRAFAGATILDMFNWITVIVLLTVEVLTGYLYRVSKAWVDVLVPDPDSMGEIKLLSALTGPFIDLIVRLDQKVLDCWSTPNITECVDKVNSSLILQKCKTNSALIDVTERMFDSNGKLVSSERDVSLHTTVQDCSSEFLFAGTSLSDAIVGVIILIASLIVLCTCLILIVKVLSSVLRGHVSVVIRKILNADIPYVPWITGYIAILLGALMTFLVQSSSVFTSSLTPLVGLGVISLKRVYPLTLGANIGTTTTAVLASFAVEPKSFAPSMQIALCHLLFNVTGILLFYPIPFLRFPIQMAKFLGNTTAKYRWFAVVYMVVMFAILPAFFIGLSFAGPSYVIALVSIVGILLMVILIIKVLQKKFPKFLPPVLKDWKWLPLPLRSLQPYDELLSKLPCCAKCRPEPSEGVENAKDNFDYYSGSGKGESGLNNKKNSKISNTSSHLQNNITNINADNKDVGNSLNSCRQRVKNPDSSVNIDSNELIQNSNNIVDNSGNNCNSEERTRNSELGSDNEGYQGSTESVIV